MAATQCVILVGGAGTRLGALSANTPKPLLPVGSRPFLDYLIDEITRQGFDDVVCLAGYRADEVRAWAHGRPPRPKISVVTEPEPLGTAGALAAARALLHDEFLMFNGDSLFDINLADFAVWQPDRPWQGVLALRLMKDTGRYGIVDFVGGAIIGFRERPAFEGSHGVINGGIYRLKRQIVDLVNPIPSSIERDIFPELARQGLLRGRIYDSAFIDIGVPSSFEEAQSFVPSLARRPALFLDRDGVLNKDIDYAFRPEQIEWIDGIFEVVKRANDEGFYVFVVTNQAGVARGLYSEKDVVALHTWMNGQFRQHGAYIDEFQYCPHHPTAGVGVYRTVCDCRKPAAGMITEILRRWPVDLSHSLLVGDRDTDLEAAQNAGLAAMLFRGGSIRDVLNGWFTANVGRRRSPLPDCSSEAS
jgi:histidinol-phosphate phosphatase family protein